MYIPCLTFALLALLPNIIAFPHDEATIEATAAEGIKSVVIIVTHTIDESSASTDASSPTNSSLVCPSPDEPCIIDGIAIWPSPTTCLTASTNPPDTLLSTTLSTSTLPDTPISSQPSTFTTCTSTELSTSSVPGNSITPLNMNTPMPTLNTLESADRTHTVPTTLDPIAWASAPTDQLAKRSTNSALRRKKASFFFVAAHPQPHPRPHQQIVRDEDNDEDEDAEYRHLLKASDESNTNTDEECVYCGKGRSLYQWDAFWVL